MTTANTTIYVLFRCPGLFQSRTDCSPIPLSPQTIPKLDRSSCSLCFFCGVQLASNGPSTDKTCLSFGCNHTSHLLTEHHSQIHSSSSLEDGDEHEALSARGPEAHTSKILQSRNAGTCSSKSLFTLPARGSAMGTSHACNADKGRAARFFYRLRQELGGLCRLVNLIEISPSARWAGTAFVVQPCRWAFTRREYFPLFSLTFSPLISHLFSK